MKQRWFNSDNSTSGDKRWSNVDIVQTMSLLYSTLKLTLKQRRVPGRNIRCFRNLIPLTVLLHLLVHSIKSYKICMNEHEFAWMFASGTDLNKTQNVMKCLISWSLFSITGWTKMPLKTFIQFCLLVFSAYFATAVFDGTRKWFCVQ